MPENRVPLDIRAMKWPVAYCFLPLFRMTLASRPFPSDREDVNADESHPSLLIRVEG